MDDATAIEGWSSAMIEERRAVLRETVAELVESGERHALSLILNNQHPADLAEVIRPYDDIQQRGLFALLAESLAAGVLAELDTTTLVDVVEGIDDQQLSDIVGEMEPDDAADVLGELPELQSEKVLELMEVEEAEEVRQLLAHEEDTGGGIMTSRLLAVGEQMRVDEAIDYLRTAAVPERIFNLYVEDAEGLLCGTLSLQSLLLAQADSQIASIVERDVIFIRADTDQEEIAHVFRDYDLLAVPVVDERGALIGEITIDDIVAVIEEEATEDMYVMAAMSSEEREERSVFGIVRRRVPWLLVCMAGTMLAGGVIHVFQQQLAGVAILLLFTPAIMAMGGNAGIQTSTVTIRNLAMGELPSGSVRTAVWRELRVALVMGLLLGSVVLCISTIWAGRWTVGLCVGLAMWSAVMLSAFLGALIPLGFRRLGVDPAVASGPLITTLNDGMSLGMYFLIASAMFAYWG